MVVIAIVCHFIALMFQVDLETPDMLAQGGDTFQRQFFADKDAHPIVSIAFDEVTQTYHFVRQRQPIRDFNLPKSTNWVQTLTQRKEFIWLSAADDKLQIGIALLQFNYISAVVVNIFCVESGRSFKQKIELPGMIGVKYIPGLDGTSSPTSTGHTVSFNSSLFRSAAASVTSTGSSLRVQSAGLVAEQSSSGDWIPFAIDFELAIPAEHLNMVFPLGPKRASMVSKFAGAKLVGPLTVHVGKETFVAPQALGGIDYTRGLLRRETTWYWTCLSARVGGDDVGLHLSAFTYDFKNVSVESTVFVNQTMHFVGAPVIWTKHLTTVPGSKDPNGLQAMWSVRTAAAQQHQRVGVSPAASDLPISIDLTFSPKDLHLGSFHYGLMTGDLYHFWGVYSGTVTVGETVYTLSHVPGPLEDHYALW